MNDPSKTLWKRRDSLIWMNSGRHLWLWPRESSQGRFGYRTLTGDGEQRIEMPPEGLWYHQQKDGSLEASSERLYSLKIENTTSVDSGTYRCILEEPEGRRNQSGTVTLKVTGCPKERKEDTFQKYRAEIVLLLALVVFYLTLIIFTCKFAQQQSIFPDFSKPGTQRAFLPVVSPNKHLEPATLHKTELV
uniref:Ig-like domain-containing protein n=1 Tax=Felis catus TaxID=9685 RepID=A0ABI7XEP1_FELCA